MHECSLQNYGQMYNKSHQISSVWLFLVGSRNMSGSWNSVWALSNRSSRLVVAVCLSIAFEDLPLVKKRLLRPTFFVELSTWLRDFESTKDLCLCSVGPDLSDDFCRSTASLGRTVAVGGGGYRLCWSVKNTFSASFSATSGGVSGRTGASSSTSSDCCEYSPSSTIFEKGTAACP